MLVLAAAGLLVPMDEKPRDYITDTPPEGARGFTVPDSVYYHRRILDGDLIEVSEAPAEVAEAAAEVVTKSTKKGGA